jgi:hypothetical protein
MHIFYHISFSSSYNEKCFRQICIDNQNTHFMFNFFFFWKSCRLWDNVEKHCKTRQATDYNIIWSMHIKCWIHKATNTYSECVIFIALPLHQWLHDRKRMLRFTALSFLLLILAIFSVAILLLSHLQGRKSRAPALYMGALNCIIPPVVTLLHGNWVPVITAWRIPRLPMVECPSDTEGRWLNMQSRTADNWCSSSLGVGRRANNSSP